MKVKQNKSVPLSLSLLILATAIVLCSCTVKNPKEELRKKGYNYDGQSFIKAAESGNLDIVALYLKAGIDVNRDDDVDVHHNPIPRTALHAASQANKHDVVKYLVDHGASVNAKGQHGLQPITLAASAGSLQIVELLVTKGADVNAADSGPGVTPLMAASSKDNIDLVKFLLSHGADVNTKSALGGTALHSAAGNANRAIVELLIASGADVNAVSNSGMTPLRFIAEAHDRQEIASTLIANGAEIDIKDQDGRTALNWAVTMRHAATVELLLEKGADVNSTDKFDMTPLHWVIWNEDNYQYKQRDILKLAQMLLMKGARVDAVDKRGRTPLNMAKTDEMRSLLQTATTGEQGRKSISTYQPESATKLVASLFGKKIYLDELQPQPAEMEERKRRLPPEEYKRWFYKKADSMMQTKLFFPLRAAYIEENKITASDNEMLDWTAELSRPEPVMLSRQQAEIDDLKRNITRQDIPETAKQRMRNDLQNREKELANNIRLSRMNHNDFKKQLQPLDQATRRFMAQVVTNWKFDRALHQRYGGRIFFGESKAVGRPLDSYRGFLTDKEKSKALQFHDQEIRAQFYEHFTKPEDETKVLPNDYYLKPFWSSNWGSFQRLVVVAGFVAVDHAVEVNASSRRRLSKTENDRSRTDEEVNSYPDVPKDGRIYDIAHRIAA